MKKRRFVTKRMKLGNHWTTVSVPVGGPITEEEFDRRTRKIFLRVLRRLEKLERQGKKTILSD